MDNKTLDQLKVAFQVAPSSQLALVICDVLAEQKDNEQLEKFVSQLDGLLSSEDLLPVANKLYERDRNDLALKLLDNEQSKHFGLIIKCMVKLGQHYDAKAMYLNKIEESPSLKQVELDELFKLEKKPQKKRN
ncbi:MAG: hypothetical protein L3J52_02405 [Proteobacteria bacterium]|nr:hypothetical protein [Pseudomonadota bacterium]